MEELTRLIAHTILDAGRSKDSGVGGLEIIYCSKAGLKPCELYSKLEGMSESLEAKIINHLLPAGQP
jgi:hypothetical protein